MWARTQGPHDPLLPRSPMSCQSAPVPMCLTQCLVHTWANYSVGPCEGCICLHEDAQVLMHPHPLNLTAVWVLVDMNGAT
ncbi:unnamed protein product, partial [Staurois parvus]